VKNANQKYILRFEDPGHRDRLKGQAVAAKRSLNRQLLLLLEAGERALYPQRPCTGEDSNDRIIHFS
jgi:hypothetical protein